MDPRRSVLRPALALAAVLPALLGGCGASAPAAESDTVRLQARLQARLDSLVAPTAVPGMTLGLVLPGGNALGLGAGMADTARATPMSPDALMLQGSVGKTYFGAVALQLVDEGRLDLDASVAEYLGDEPWFGRIPNGRTATVRDLMGHTSGIVRYEFNPAFLEDLTAEPMRTFTPEERLSYLFDTEAPFPAGEGWEYSDTNFILLAMIVEEVLGEPAYAAIHERLLDPHGLSSTRPSDTPEIPGLAQGYAGPGNPFGGFDAMVEDGRLRINPQFEWGGGGFASTARDLARWTRLVHEFRVFSADRRNDFLDGTPAPLGPNGRYGLGVILVDLPTAGPARGHSGFMPGYRTEAYWFERGGFAMALQINTTSSGALTTSPLMMLDGLAAIVQEELGGADETEADPDPDPDPYPDPDPETGAERP